MKAVYTGNMGSDTLGVMHRGEVEVRFIAVADHTIENFIELVMWTDSYMVIAVKESYVFKSMVLYVNMGLQGKHHDVPAEDIDHDEFKQDAVNLTAEWLTLVYQYVLKNPGDVEKTHMDATLDRLLAD